MVEDEIQSSYAARNKGIRNAKGSILAFIDADMTVKTDWLSLGVGSMIEKNAEYLACNVEIYSSGCESLSAKYNRLTGFPIKKYIEEYKFGPTCCILVDRKLFEEVGYFDARMISGGDKEFGNRVYNSGKRFYFEPNIVMYHPARSTLSSLLKKDFRVGKGIAQLRKYYPERYGNLAKDAFNFRVYLPPKPWKVKNELSNCWDKLSFSEKIGFYIIFYFKRVYKHLGEFVELVR